MKITRPPLRQLGNQISTFSAWLVKVLLSTNSSQGSRLKNRKSWQTLKTKPCSHQTIVGVQRICKACWVFGVRPGWLQWLSPSYPGTKAPQSACAQLGLGRKNFYSTNTGCRRVAGMRETRPWEQSSYLSQISQISFWEILRNLGNFGIFCQNLRDFMWRKIEPKKYICGEKMTNMRSASI